MNDHNLDDLIIGEPEPNGGKSKSILTLLALLAIVVIVGVILYQLIMGGGEEELSGESGTAELTSLVNPAMHQNPTFGKPVQQEPIPEELKPIVEEKLPAPAVKKPAARQPVRETIAPKPKHEAIAPSSTGKPKPTAKKETAKPKAQAKPTQKKPSELFRKSEETKSGTTAKKSYYIQVGSFKRPPTQKFLDEMKAKGYKPILVKSGEMIKVRVGPYNSYDAAKAKLPEIKEKLGISGFVVRKK